MSENENTQAAPSAGKKKPAVLLNIKGVPFVETELQRAGEDKKGLIYPAIPKDFILEQFAALAAMLKEAGKELPPLFNVIPLDVVARQTFSKQKQQNQVLYTETFETEDDWSTANMAEFEKYITEGKSVSRGETKAELEAQQAELVDDLIAAGEKQDMVEFLSISNQLKAIKEAIEAKSRNRKAKATPAPESVTA